jgi:ATP-dependent helicase/nuclease subunit A
VGCNVYAPELHTRYPSLAKTAIAQRTREENLSEELRVLYVAMTRPQNMLIMTYCAEKLNGKLSALAKRLTPETSRMLAAEATCMGDWVLQAALLRTEAGELHAVGGKPAGTSVSQIPWRICYHDVSAPRPQAPAPLPSAAAVPQPEAGELFDSLSFRYPAPEACRIPAKITATQLKGRRLDEEADDRRVRSSASGPKWRAPLLQHAEKPLTPAQRGTAVHQAMQFLRFDHVSSEEEIRAQLEEMVRSAFLTEKQAEAVDPKKLYAVFTGPLGDLIRGAEQVIREFKFSILVDAENYFPGAGEEKLLLQGVTDCCLIRDGALTVVDFKTDRLKPGQEAEAAAGYRPQLEAYSLALERIFGLPVRGKLLYFFSTDALFALD